MKKLIVLVLLACGLSAIADDYRDYVIREIDLTASAGGALTNSASWTVPANKVAYPLAVYQDITTQTNTVTVSQTVGDASSTVDVETLSAVTDTTEIETVGLGDVSDDIDDIIVTGGNTITLTGIGADSTNVVYALRVKVENQ